MTLPYCLVVDIPVKKKNLENLTFLPCTFWAQLWGFSDKILKFRFISEVLTNPKNCSEKIKVI